MKSPIVVLLIALSALSVTSGQTVAEGQSSASETCNVLILTKKNDAISLNNCEIAVRKQMIESAFPAKELGELLAGNGVTAPLRAYETRMAFYESGIRIRMEITQAIKESVITKKEAMKIREDMIEKEAKQYYAMKDKEERDMASINHPIQSSPAPQAEKRPTSMTCKKDLIGTTRCELN